jgi:uncharacterized coiled-coil protein SlyX
MTGNEVEALAILTMVLGGGTVLLLTIRMFLNYRLRRLGGGGDQIAELSDAVQDLRRDLAETRADLADVHERIDFAERLLAQARDERRLPPGP